MKNFIAYGIILKLIPWPLSKGQLVRCGNRINTHVIVFNVHIMTLTEERFN